MCGMAYCMELPGPHPVVSSSVEKAFLPLFHGLPNKNQLLSSFTLDVELILLPM